MLLGEFHHNIDEKGRLVIPTKFREELQNNFIITKGLEKCLCIYTQDSFNNLVRQIDALSFTKKDVRTFTRFFYSSANECEMDKNGRINIVNNLKSYAQLEKECIIVGVNDHAEIWNENLYNDFMNENSEIICDITENLFEGEN
ncbi:transcriptional regulator MraZ [bacterium]|nr:transcriptional regulator MraZ [bacterium]